jgi:hypothetical protein
MTCAHKFDPALSATQPTRTDCFLQYLLKKGTLDILPADSLVILRVLQGFPSWRALIAANLSRILSAARSREPRESADLSLLQIAAFGVVGGHIDRLR